MIFLMHLKLPMDMGVGRGGGKERGNKTINTPKPKLAHFRYGSPYQRHGEQERDADRNDSDALTVNSNKITVLGGW